MQQEQPARRKTKRKNPLLRLLVLLACAAVLFAVYYAARKINEKKAAEEAARLAAMTPKPVIVADFDPAELTEIAYETPGTTDGTVKLMVVNGAWQWADDPVFPLDQTAVSMMGNAVTKITAVREITSLEADLSGYGLAEPSAKITAKYGSESHDYLLGSYNGTAGGYYLMADGAVYLTETNMLSAFSKSLADLIKRDSVPSADWTDRSLVSSVTVRGGEGERTLTEEEEIDAALTALSSVYLRQYAEYKSDEAKKAEYGLDGSRSVTVNYRKAVTTSDQNGNSSTNYLDTSYVFLVGNPAPEDETLTAAAPASSGIVYLIPTDTAEKLLSAGE